MLVWIGWKIAAARVGERLVRVVSVTSLSGSNRVLLKNTHNMDWFHGFVEMNLYVSYSEKYD